MGAARTLTRRRVTHDGQSPEQKPTLGGSFGLSANVLHYPA